MAYVVSQTTTSTEGTTTASFVTTIPTDAQADGDYILIAAINDAGTTALGIDAGWTEVYKSAAAVSGTRAGIWYKKRSGSDVTAPTLTGTNEDWIACAMLIRDADGTTFLDVAVGTTEQTASTQTPAAPSVTPTNTNTLVLRILAMDSGAYSNPSAGWGTFTDVVRYTDTGTLEMYIAQQLQSAASATGTFTWERNQNDGGVLATLAIRNKTNGGIPAAFSGAPTVVNRLDVLASFPTFTSIQSIQATIAGQTTLVPSSGPTASQGTTYATDPNWNGCFATVTLTPPASTGAFGFYWTTTADFSAGKPFAMTLACPSAAALSNDGPLFYFEDGSGNWRTWRPAKRAVLGNGVFRAFTADLPNESFVDSSGTINWASVTRVGLVLINVTATSTARAFSIRGLYTNNPLVVTGGNTAKPITPSDIAQCILSGTGIYRGFVQGSGQALSTIPIQIGDGSTATYYKASAQSLEYDIGGLATKPWFRLGAQDQEFRIKASASDTIDLSASILATTTSQNLVIDSGSSTSATYVFTAASIVGWTVTWKTGVTCDGATFSGCAEIDGQGGTFNNCTITDTTSTDAAIAFTANSTMTGTEIDVTGTSAAYHIELGTSVTAFTLTDVTFTGTPATDKVHVKKTTGTVTISIAGTTSLAAGDVTSDGATVVISAPPIYQSVVITNLTVGSRVQIYDTTNSSELANEVAGSSSVTWTDGTAYVADRDIRVRIAYATTSTAKRFIESDIGTVGDGSPNSETLTYRANQVDDSVYVNNAIDGSAVSGVTFTDAATDLVNINVVANTISWKQIYAAWVWYAFGATGIASDIDYIDAVDEANYILSNMLVKNTSSPTAPLEITGGYGRDATTLAAIDLVDTTGGTIVMAPDHVVSYATGSGLTAGQDAKLTAIDSATTSYLDATISSRLAAAGYTTPPTAVAIRQEIDSNSTKLDVAVGSRLATAGYTAPDNSSITSIKAKTDSLTFTVAGSVDANVSAVNGTEVGGSGTRTDPWGPV